MPRHPADGSLCIRFISSLSAQIIHSFSTFVCRPRIQPLTAHWRRVCHGISTSAARSRTHHSPRPTASRRTAGYSPSQRQMRTNRRGYRRPITRPSQPDALGGASASSQTNRARTTVPSALNTTRIEPAPPFQARVTLPSTRSGGVSSSAGYPKRDSTCRPVMPGRIRSQLSAVIRSAGHTSQTASATARTTAGIPSSSIRRRVSTGGRQRVGAEVGPTARSIRGEDSAVGRAAHAPGDGPQSEPSADGPIVAGRMLLLEMSLSGGGAATTAGWPAQVQVRR
jgi:hypothetical protein